MKIKTALILSLILFTCHTCFSQGKRYIYYFDADLQPTSKSKATIIGTGTKENDVVKLVCVDNKSQQVVLVGYFTDSSLHVHDGLYVLYYYNGNKASEENYDKGKQNGLFREWDNAGRLTDSTIYEHGKKISEAKFSYRKSGQLSHADFTDFSSDKEQVYNYNDSGKVSSEVSFTGNIGILKHYNKEGIKLDTVYARGETEAMFPGGDAGWTRYITDEIRQNIDELMRDNQSGTCRVKFIIDKDGYPKDVTAVTMKGTKLAEVAVRAIANGPKWIPAVQYGRKVNAYREQPVTFTISSR
jgi:hypothetical protein